MLNNFKEAVKLKHLYFNNSSGDRYLFGDNINHVRNTVGGVGGGGAQIFRDPVNPVTEKGQGWSGKDFSAAKMNARVDNQGGEVANQQSVTDSLEGNYTASEFQNLIKNNASGQYLDLRTSKMSPEVMAAFARGEKVHVKLTQLAPERVNLFMPLLASVMQIVGGMNGAAYNEELSQVITGSKEKGDKGQLGRAADFVGRHGTSYSLNPFGGGEHIDIIAEFELMNQPPKQATPVVIPPLQPPHKRKTEDADVPDIAHDPIPVVRVTEGDRGFTADISHRAGYLNTDAGQQSSGVTGEGKMGIREKVGQNVGFTLRNNLTASPPDGHGMQLSEKEKALVYANEGKTAGDIDKDVFYLGAQGHVRTAEQNKDGISDLEKSFTKGFPEDSKNVVQARRYVLLDYLDMNREGATVAGKPVMTEAQKGRLDEIKKVLDNPNATEAQKVAAGHELFEILKAVETNLPLTADDQKVGTEHITGAQAGIINRGQQLSDASAGSVAMVNSINGNAPKTPAEKQAYADAYNKANGRDGGKETDPARLGERKKLTYEQVQAKEQTAFAEAYNEANELDGTSADKKPLSYAEIEAKLISGDKEGFLATEASIGEGFTAMKASLDTPAGKALREHPQVAQLYNELGTPGGKTGQFGQLSTVTAAVKSDSLGHPASLDSNIATTKAFADKIAAAPDDYSTETVANLDKDVKKVGDQFFAALEAKGINLSADQKKRMLDGERFNTVFTPAQMAIVLTPAEGKMVDDFSTMAGAAKDAKTKVNQSLVNESKVFISGMQDNLKRLEAAIKNGTPIEVDGKPIERAELLNKYDADFREFLLRKPPLPIEPDKCAEIANTISRLGTATGVRGNKEVSDVLKLIQDAKEKYHDDKIDTATGTVPGKVAEKTPESMKPVTDNMIKDLKLEPGDNTLKKINEFEAKPTKENYTALLEAIKAGSAQLSDKLFEIAQRLLEQAKLDGTDLGKLSTDLTQVFKSSQKTGEKIQAALELLDPDKYKKEPGSPAPVKKLETPPAPKVDPPPVPKVAPPPTAKVDLPTDDTTLIAANDIIKKGMDGSGVSFGSSPEFAQPSNVG